MLQDSKYIILRKENCVMNKMIRKVLVGVMAAAMMLGTTATAFAAGTDSATVVETKPEKQTNVKAENGYKVNTSSSGKATVSAVPKTSKTSVTISSKVEVDGVKYTVTRIEAKTFENAKKATKVTLPSTITSIGAKAFTGADKVKTIAITSKDTVKVSKDAFKGVNTKKMTITVKVSKKGMTTSEYNAFVKSLKKAGFKGKIKKVK